MVYGFWFMIDDFWFVVYDLWFMVENLWSMICCESLSRDRALYSGGGVGWFGMYRYWFTVCGSQFQVSGFRF